MTTATATTEKTALQIINEVDDNLIELRRLPTIINLMMENFGFDSLELTENNKFDIINRHEMITDVLNLTLSTIYDTLEKIEKISAKKDSDE